MAKVNATLTGLPEARQQLRRVLEVVEEEARARLKARARSAAGTAQTHAPRETGALASKIVAVAEGLTAGVAIDAGAVGDRTPALYWRYPEFGTVHMTPRPFLRPAADAETKPFEDDMRAIGPALERRLRR